MFIAASSRCFSDLKFEEACRNIVGLDYDRIDIWLDETSNHLTPSEVASNPEAFLLRYRDLSRLTPVAFTVAHDIDNETMAGLCTTAKLLRTTQITVPSSPIGTPFNSEIDRLKQFVSIGNEAGIRISIHTKSGQLTEDPHTAVELCQSVRGLGLSLDPSYYICGSHSDASWDQVFPYVYHTLLRDSTDKQVQVQVGLGEVDYARIIQLLARENYNRALSVDFDHAQMDDEMRALEMRKLRLLLETLL
ncbi:MAG: TIM barrel protein [Planctomycetota bacterium]|nr:TIM barrel protein [Planctomycetota bacterium]